jgi:hypothetical protein
LELFSESETIDCLWREIEGRTIEELIIDERDSDRLWKRGEFEVNRVRGLWRKACIKIGGLYM